MNPPGMPRTVADARTARSIPVRPGPVSEQQAYALLAQLARERQRLLGQQELWQRKLDQITRRVAEIDAETGRLRRQRPEVPEGHQAQRQRQRPPMPEIEFGY